MADEKYEALAPIPEEEQGEVDGEEIAFLEECKLAFHFAMAKHVGGAQTPEPSESICREVGKVVLQKSIARDRALASGARVGNLRDADHSECPNHLFDGAKEWVRQGPNKWSSGRGEPQPQLEGFLIYHCPEHYKTFMVWTGQHCVLVGGDLMDTVLFGLATFVERREEEEVEEEEEEGKDDSSSSQAEEDHDVSW